MSTPLVFQHGAASVAFSVELFGWLVFEAVMRVRQRLRSQGAPTWDPSAVVLVPCLAGSIIAAQLLGRRGGLPWPGGLLWPAVLGGAGLAVRIRAEERQLTQALGEEYRQCAARRKRLVPGLF
jgi:protein-S-isoprenylcysteine O-methyltransferase Ste14